MTVSDFYVRDVGKNESARGAMIDLQIAVLLHLFPRLSKWNKH